ncbi:MAG: YmdB family metallophosphoesterase [Candidatus Riflebacteria bacterium]|nr:YmdB family metallophosphoesterase [Candidatus Riflebacteria bacterium]
MQSLLFLGEILHELPPDTIKRLLDDPGSPAAEFVTLNGTGLIGNTARLFDVFEKLFDNGIDVITLGESALSRPASRELLDRFPRIIRPLNVSPHSPGKGNIFLKCDSLSFWMIALAMPTDRRPLDDPFHVIEAWLDGPGRDLPGFVHLLGEDRAMKQALVWRYRRSQPPIHWLGTGLGAASRRVFVREGTLFVPDIGVIGAEGNIAGMAPERWWKRYRERLHTESLPPITRITAEGVLLRLESSFKIDSVESILLPPQ